MSRLHRRRVGAKFSHSLYRPLPDPGGPGRREVFPWLASATILLSDPDKHVQGDRSYLSAGRPRRPKAPRYPPTSEGCALLPRHHAGPKELLSADHFDAVNLAERPWFHRDHREFPHGEQARTGGPFTSYVKEGSWSNLLPSLGNRAFTARDVETGERIPTAQERDDQAEQEALKAELAQRRAEHEASNAREERLRAEHEASNAREERLRAEHEAARARALEAELEALRRQIRGEA